MVLLISICCAVIIIHIVLGPYYQQTFIEYLLCLVATMAGLQDGGFELRVTRCFLILGLGE